MPPEIRRVAKQYWKDSALALLAVAVLVLGALALRGRLSAGPLVGGEAVEVFDVVVDRADLKHFELVFDRPLGAGMEGQILARAPATITPALGGVWKWREAHALRFEAADRLAMATDYEIELIADRLVQPGQRLADGEVTVRTDQFVVERADLREEPGAEPRTVVLRGELRFNYDVDPRQLVDKIRLLDPTAAQPVEVALETGYRSSTIGIRSAPLRKERDERKVKLVIDAELTPARGNVPLGGWEHEIPIGSSERLAVRGVTPAAALPDSSIRIELSSPVDPDAVRRFVVVEPRVETRLGADATGLVLTGGLTPGKRYVVKLAAGLPGTDGARLPEAWEAKVDLPDVDPALAFQSEGMFLSLSGPHAFNLETVNTGEVAVAVDRVFPNNLFSLLQFASWEFDNRDYYDGPIAHALGSRLAERSVAVKGPRNREVVTRVDLDPFLDGQEKGLYRVAVRRDGEYQGSQRWMLVTDLGVVAKRGEDGLRLWVWSFRDLSPVAGAQVRVVSTQNQTLATGRTGADGSFTAADLPRSIAEPGDEGRQPSYVTVENGDDWSFLLLERGRVDTTGFDVGGATRSAQGYSAFLYGERNLYRPGETVRGVAVVRDRDLQPPPAMPLVLRHRDPQGRQRADRRLSLGEGVRRGLAELSLELPTYALTGTHSLELLAGEEVIGTWPVQVEEFVPDRIEVQIAPATAEVRPGGKLAYAVAAQYLFGPPGAGLPVETRVRLAASFFAPPGFEGYQFADPGVAFEDREIFAQEGTLDAQGRAAYEVALPDGLRAPAGLEAIVTARVQEQGGRGVAALQRVRVHPYPRYLGLRRLGEDWVEPGQPMRFAWVAVTPDGKPAKAGALRAELFRDDWNTVLRRQPSGGYGYESSRDSTLVDSQAIPAGQSAGELTFSPRRVGTYRLVLREGDGASASLESFVSGWGYSPWAMKSPARIELELERPEYAPGETAKLLVKAPFSGKLLVTVERDEVLSTQIHSLDGNTAEISIPVRAEWRPNVYVSAMLVRQVGDLEPGGVGRAFGVVPLAVDREANRLQVQIAAPAQMRPRGPLRIEVRTSPAAAGTAVTVAAVDEGILQLVAQKTPDPFAHFYAKLALGVDAFDLFSQLLPDVAAKTATGGGEDLDGLAQFLRTEGIRRVEPVALWSGVLETDAAGVARVELAVPEFQGALRVMAVALRDDRFGAGEQMVRVRDPLVLLPTFPRFLSFAEQLEVPVSVRNDTGRAGRFEVTLAVTGPVTIEGDAKRTVEVADGAEALVHFGLRTADRPGAVRVQLQASGNGERAAAAVNLETRADLPARTVERTGALSEAVTTLPAADLAAFRPVTLSRELVVSPVPLVRLAGKLEDLLRYPYGCVEQTVSSAFPLLYLGDLARQLEPDLFAQGDPVARAQDAIRRLANHQLYGGGFAMWPGMETPQPWASIYATHFLVEARRAGLTVAPFLHDGALDYVARELSGEQQVTLAGAQRIAYAAYVLARAGRADLAAMDLLRERSAKQADLLSADSRALLAAAYAAAGNPQAVEQLVGSLREVEEVARQTGGNFDSTVRRRALVLLALLDAAPGDARIPALAEQLMREATTGGWTTQETSFALLAVGQLFHRQAARAPYRGEVFAGERRIAALEAKTTRVAVPGTAPVRVAMAPGYESGAAFFHLRLRGVPTDAAFQPGSAGLEVERAFLDRDGKPLDLGAVEQGDLVVVRARVRSVAGPLENVVVENLLPSGLEVENPRLTSSETLPWADPNLTAQFVDVRDDRVLLFLDLPANQWQTTYAVLRAVTTGTFRLPPLQAEAMYNPALRATGERGEMVVRARQ